MISTKDLSRLKDSAKIMTPQAVQEKIAQMNMTKTMIAEAGAARKQNMLRLEKERRRATSQTLQSDEEMRVAQQAMAVLDAAREKTIENLDDVKHMNQMMEYARCVTIRDAQINEKQRMQEEASLEDRRLDTIMELERLKQVQLHESRERSRQELQKQGAQLITRQILDREADRIRRQELRDRDAQVMLQRIKDEEAKEEEKRLVKLEEGRRLLDQVVIANNAQARAKLRRKQEEIEEDQRIAAYLLQKQAREKELEEKQDRLRVEREKEIARLRAQQERAQDRQSAMDELRAKRYQEDLDRQWRVKQLEDAKKQEALKSEIADARSFQRLEKEKRMVEQVALERDEYGRVLQWQQEQRERELQKAEELALRKKAYRSQLLTQMKMSDLDKELARTLLLEDGRQMAIQAEQEKAALEAVKTQKLEALRNMGIPEKYCTELSKKKVLHTTIH